MTTETVDGGATPEISVGSDGVVGIVGVDGVPATGGVELLEPPPLQAATNVVNRTQGRARVKRKEPIAEPP